MSCRWSFALQCSYEQLGIYRHGSGSGQAGSQVALAMIMMISAWILPVKSFLFRIASVWVHDNNCSYPQQTTCKNNRRHDFCRQAHVINWLLDKKCIQYCSSGLWHHWKLINLCLNHHSCWSLIIFWFNRAKQVNTSDILRRSQQSPQWTTLK